MKEGSIKCPPGSMKSELYTAGRKEDARPYDFSTNVALHVVVTLGCVLETADIATWGDCTGDDLHVL